MDSLRQNCPESSSIIVTQRCRSLLEVEVRRMGDSTSDHIDCQDLSFRIISKASHVIQQQLLDKQYNGEILRAAYGLAEHTSKSPSPHLPKESVSVVPHHFACSRG